MLSFFVFLQINLSFGVKKFDELDEIKESMNELRTAESLAQHQVVFLTAQKLVNALANGQMQVSELSMIIFDECHHTSYNHPYHEIMRYYRKE